MSKTIQMKTTITTGGTKQQVNGYPVTTPDRVIDSEGVSVEEALSEKQDVTSESLQTENKQIVSAINEVNSLAKQADKAKSFVNYQALITYLNSADTDEFRSGQIFNIQTTNVPDLWVFSVENASVPYTYTTDAAFITATSQSGGQQVGYYKLAQLEILIDLADYVKKTDYASTTIAGLIKTASEYGTGMTSSGKLRANEVTYEYFVNSLHANAFIGKNTLLNFLEGKGYLTSADLSGKLDKVTDASSSSVYVTLVGGEQGVRQYTTAAGANTIMYRDANGRVKVASPSAASEAANKGYVDDHHDSTKQDTISDLSTIRANASNAVQKTGDTMSAPLIITTNDWDSMKVQKDSTHYFTFSGPGGYFYGQYGDNSIQMVPGEILGSGAAAALLTGYANDVGYTAYFPKKDGTLAMTSDIPHLYRHNITMSVSKDGLGMMGRLVLTFLTNSATAITKNTIIDNIQTNTPVNGYLRSSDGGAYYQAIYIKKRSATSTTSFTISVLKADHTSIDSYVYLNNSGDTYIYDFNDSVTQIF